MRLAPLLLLLSLLSARLSAAETEFVRIWPGWRDADTFDRIREYFGGTENTSREIALRTDPAVRAGYYFLVRVRNATAAPAAKFELGIIPPGAAEATTYTFPTALPAHETVFLVGLTGAAWPGGKKAIPVAWKLSLLASDGRLLAEQKSFMWEKPAR